MVFQCVHSLIAMFSGHQMKVGNCLFVLLEWCVHVAFIVHVHVMDTGNQMQKYCSIYACNVHV